MWDEVARFETNYELLSQHKRLCTSEPLERLDRKALPQAVESDAIFRTLVSTLYMLWHERWGRDVGFLLTRNRSAVHAKSFNILRKKIRTAHQHSNNVDAVQALNTWLYQTCGNREPAVPEDWARCAKELIALMNKAVIELVDVAMFVGQRENERVAWQQRVAESVRSAVVRVAADLGLRLGERAIEYHERQVDNRWRRYRLPAGQDVRPALDSLVERQLMSQVAPLPSGHLEVLEVLDIVGSEKAFAGLQLAHAVAAISRTRGESFLKLVVTTWSSLQPTGHVR